MSHFRIIWGENLITIAHAELLQEKVSISVFVLRFVACASWTSINTVLAALTRFTLPSHQVSVDT